MPNLAVATYDNLATAKLVTRTLEAIGIGADDIHLLAPPDLVPAEADLTTRDRLERLGVPSHEAQLLADMVQGGNVLVAVAPASGADALRQTLAVLTEAQPSEPLAVFEVAPGAARSP
jgi:hypothetical protein